MALTAPHPRPNHPIRGVLHQRRISFAQFGKAIGYSRASVNQIVNGHQHVTKRFARNASEVLGLPIEELFDDLRDDWAVAQ